MRSANINLRTAVLLGTLVLVSTWGLRPASGQADPNGVPPIFVSAGGPYSGTVGVPIEFDASLSLLANGSDIEGYYWDWDLDKHFECFTFPKCEHTWQCAYSGPVRLYLFDDEGNVDWAQTHVTVTGPETAARITLNGSADLHVYDAGRRHVGLNYATNGPEIQITEATFCITDEAGNPVPLYGCTLDEGLCQQVRFPLYDGGPYGVRLVGISDGPFELTVHGCQDGDCIAQESYKGEIFAGEIISVSMTACCTDDGLTMTCGPLCYCPGIKITPEKIDLSVDPATTYEVGLTITETTGRRPLRSVTLRCSDLTGPVHPIKGADVSFDLNAKMHVGDRRTFDVEPGGQQEVLISIPVPVDFLGRATGSITTECLDGVGKTVEVIVGKKGFHAPVCDPGGPYEGTIGTPITFDAGWSYDPDGTLTQFCWDWDWDGQFECTSAPKIQHTWNDLFTGTVLLRITDNDGHTAQKSVSVIVKEPED